MAKDIWTAKHVQSLSPDEASIPAARKVLKKGGFGTVEPTADGRGWWVVCQGLTDTYQVSARLRPDDELDSTCTCPSYKNPCKHALALLFYLVDHPELRVEKENPKAEASDFDALLKAVFAHPDDDTPRLVFADFVEENGDSDRAALIRLQCEQARLKPAAKRYKELTAALKPLVAKAKKRIEPLPDGFECRLERGFLRLEGDLIHISDADALPARFTDLFRDGWVESIRVDYFDSIDLNQGVDRLLAQIGELNVSNYPIDADAMVTLAAGTADARARGRLARVVVHRANKKAFDALVRAQAGEAVSLGGSWGAERRHGYLNPRTFDLMLRTGQLSGARAMTLGGSGLGDEQLKALIDTADLSKLRELWLSEWDLSRAGISALADTDALGGLTELNLYSIPLGASATNAVPVLAGNRGLRAVKTLRFLNCAIEDDDVRPLAASKNFPQLVELEVSQNPDLTAAGAAALLAAKHVPHLSRVNLEGTQVAGREQLPLLLAAPDRPSLRVVFDHHIVQRAVKNDEVIVEVESRTNGYDGVFDDTATAKGAERVTQLHASKCHLGTAEMPDLVAGFDTETLWKLDLTDNPLRNDGVAALATALAEFNLRELILVWCRIQGAGVAALTASDIYTRLHTLNLSRNTIGKAGCAALLKAAVPPNLKKLILTECRLTADDQKKLKAKFGARLKL